MDHKVTHWSNELLTIDDNCGGTVIYTYRFTVEDNCNNTSTTDATFEIQDTTPPMITIPAEDLEYQCDGNDNVIQLLDWLKTMAMLLLMTYVVT